MLNIWFVFLCPFASCPAKIHPTDINLCVTRFTLSSRISGNIVRSLNASYRWFLSKITCNKKMHAMNGNMVPQFNVNRKGKGKGLQKGKSQVEQDEISFQNDIRSSLPAAAVQRMQPQLFPSDWSVPTRFPQDMQSQPGVALVPKQMVAQVLRNIGYCRQPIAILTTQPASQLHMDGYTCREVFVRINVRTNDGDYKELNVRRYLIQVGFGDEVTQVALGDLVELPETMIKCVAKMPQYFGWSLDTIKGSTISDMLSKRIDIRAVEQIQCREDGSATFLIHESFVPALLKSSGQDAMFIKIHSSAADRFPHELLWLPDEVSFEQALQYADADKVCGLVVKNAKQKPRYALRFCTNDDLKAVAEQHQFPDTTALSRWRLDGLLPVIGSAGVLGLLEERDWLIDTILYFGDRHCVFTATTVGNLSPMHYQMKGQERQLMRFKAINAPARAAQESANKSKSSASGTSSVSSAGQATTTWLRKLRPTRKPFEIPVSPSKPEPTKRPAPNRTGETPPGKKDKDM